MSHPIIYLRYFRLWSCKDAFLRTIGVAYDYDTQKGSYQGGLTVYLWWWNIEIGRKA